MKSARYLAAATTIAPIALLALATPATAQEDTAAEPTAYDGDYLSVGFGVGYVPSYDGSDDYVFFPAPILQGSLKGIGISPRPGGLALDFIPNAGKGPHISAGVAARVRRNRASDIKDPVVASLGRLDTAVEVGPTLGISFPALLNPYDSLSVKVDARWDVAGAHGGMVVDPSVTYFTPLSRGMAASLTFSAEHGDGKYLDYYYTISPAQAGASGLPAFDATGGGFTKAGANLLLGVDMDGNLANGGLAVVVIGGYSRMLGDAKASPVTSIRGSADQWFGGLGVGYTF
ncbi:MAG: hypothetical protein RLZZ08_949 [Pseudomonadota bacterium]|jgi:outer membrane scaffolding protein for murein synthesis (MipA/OmpV family)